MLGCRSHQRGEVGLGCGLSRGQEDSEVGPPQAALRWLEGQDGVLRSCQDRAGSDCRYIESQHLPGLGGSELPCLVCSCQCSVRSPGVAWHSPSLICPGFRVASS